VHRLAPQVKLVLLLMFVVFVVRPQRAVWAFGLYGLVLLAAAGARLPLRTLVTRMAVELPFVAFAFALPFVASGPRHVVLGGHFAYVSAASGLVVVDLDDPLMPRLAARVPLDSPRAAALQFRYPCRRACRGRSPPSPVSWCDTST
jgi:energy-coupling factor transporter transmembrane protein EcfT